MFYSSSVPCPKLRKEQGFEAASLPSKRPAARNIKQDDILTDEKFEFPSLYTEFAKYYDRLESQYRDYPRESEWLIEILKGHNCKEVIDVSCGTGSHLALLQKEDFNLYGIDASKQMIRLAKKKLAFGKEVSLIARRLSSCSIQKRGVRRVPVHVLESCRTESESGQVLIFRSWSRS